MSSFGSAGAEIEIDGLQRLPERLTAALDPDLLYEYFGAGEADDDAIEFLESLKVEALLITTVNEARGAVAELSAEHPTRVGIDIETTARPDFAERRPPVSINVDGSVSDRLRDKQDRNRTPSALDPHRAEIATLQLYAGGNTAFVFRGEALRHILESTWLHEQRLIAHNAAFELAFLGKYGLKIWCTMQAGGLVVGTGFGGERRSLQNVAKQILGVEPPKALGTSDWGAPRLSDGQVAYAAGDAVLAFRLWPKLRSELLSHGREKAFKLQQGATPATVAMELMGLRLDRDEHARQVADWSRKLAEARREFLAITGSDPPVNDNQVRDWLVRSVPEETLSGWPLTPKDARLSTQGKHLKRLLPMAGVEQLLTMQSMQQLLSNFGSKLVGFVSPATGRIHARFNLAATKAGRFSASKPNLQQLPSDKVAPNFRACIIPAPGHRLVGCDWNQVEMRAAAWLSRDFALTAVYAADPVRDLHRETAAAISGTPYAEVTAAQRQSAKPTNFGAIYGIGALTLSEDAFDSYGIIMSEAEAQNALDRFFQTYYGFDEWRWENWNWVKATQRVVVPGSGRTVEACWEHNGQIRFTQSCNIPIQGICADALMLAMRLVHARLRGLDAGLVACLHDELLVEASEAHAEQARAILEEAMVEAFVTTFPGAPHHGVAEAKIGKSWGELK